MAKSENKVRLKAAKLYHAEIRRVLLSEWDPIGVNDEPNAQDEYDSYVGEFYSLLIRRRPVHEIADFLWWIETNHMGLCGNRAKTQRIAEQLKAIGDLLSGPSNTA